MKPLLPYTLKAEFVVVLGTTSELLEADLDQANRVLEEALSMALLQFLGEDGKIVVLQFSFHLRISS
jgi:hypothetical protein